MLCCHQWGDREVRKIPCRFGQALAQLHRVADIPVLTGFGVKSSRCRTFQCGVRWCYRWFEIVKALHQGEPIEDFIKQAVAYQK